MSPTDKLVFAWYNNSQIFTGIRSAFRKWIATQFKYFINVTKEHLTGFISMKLIPLSTETQKEAMPNEETSTNLVVDALTVDTTYTCKVQSHQEYSFTSTIEVNGIRF